MARVPGLIKRAPRIDLRRPAVLIDSAGAETVVTILDVSSGGFKLQVAETPRIGEVVTLRVDGSGDIEAQIRWALGDQAGGVFLTDVDYSALP
jgi:PilZ domain